MNPKPCLYKVFCLALITASLGAHPSLIAGKQKPKSIEQSIIELLRDQQAAWNRGDLEGYMQGYWQSPKLRFASGDRVKRGWKTALDGYKKNYPTPAAMGRLVFSEIEITPLDNQHAIAFGRWTLTRKAQSGSERLTGLFTLTLKRFPDGNWRIIQDHTC